MVDVFVSYKAEDRKRVKPLVDALIADGLSVWWDAHIGGGSDWRESIEENLEGAECVIVVWSRRSVGPQGRFVRDEASRAQRNNAYLPIRIDRVEPPLGFGETQAISLIGWAGDTGDERYQSVRSAVRAVIAGTHVSSRHVEDTAPEAGVSRRAVLATGGGLVAAAVVGGFLWLRPGAARANSIAVLPFANLSGDPAQNFFSDGLAEELRAVLARVEGLKVMARTSSEKVRDDDIQTAAEKLGVDTILTGSVRRSPETVRINAQLADGKDGLERWSETYDRPAGDALTVQTEIAAEVAAALKVELGGAAAAVANSRSGNPQAQEAYLHGKSTWQGNPTSARLKQAVGMFDEAIRADPNFADAYAQKAVAMLVYTQTFAASSAEHERDVGAAEAFARKALSLASGLRSAHAALGIARSARFDFGGALSEFNAAFADSANGSDLVAEYARFLASVGRKKAAADWAGRGVEADPLNPRAHQSRIYALYCERNYAGAIAAARELLRWSPGRSSTLSRLGDCLLLTGKAAEAEAAYAQADADYPPRIFGEAIVAAKAGDRAKADEALARLSERFGDLSHYRAAQVHTQRGEGAPAIAALEQAIRVKDPGVIALPTDPFIDPLRGDERFRQLAAGLRFPA